MKLIRCSECRDVVALSLPWRVCFCGASAAKYNSDGDSATVAGPCDVYGLSNRVFITGTGDAFRYPEDNGKIARLPAVPDDARP